MPEGQTGEVWKAKWLGWEQVLPQPTAFALRGRWMPEGQTDEVGKAKWLGWE